MSWVGQIMLGAYLVFILGTVAMLLATILLATAEWPSPGKGRASSEVWPGGKATGICRQRVDLNQTSDPL